MQLDSTCIFGDLTDIACSFWPNDPRAKIQTAKTSPMRGHLYCYRHCRRCPLRHVDLDITGTPCTDYSLAHGQRMGILGKTFPVFLCWSQLIQRLEVPLWIHENVVQQPSELFRDVFDAEMYRIIHLEVSPDMVGFNLIARRRRYTVGINVKRAELIADPEEMLQFITGHLSNVQTQPKDALLADLPEILQEVQYVCDLRSMVLPDYVLQWTSVAQVDLSGFLNRREKESLEGYTLAYLQRFGSMPAHDQNAFFFLGDSAPSRLTWSCVSNKLPTLRRNGGRCWSPYARRWLTAKELLSAMGFPCYDSLAQAMGVPTMVFDSTERARTFLGNAMHAGAAGVVALVCLSCVRMRDA